MKRVYISKSKVGNPDDLMNLRHLLSKWDCKVTEFFGGVYNTKELDRANLLLVIPPYVESINNRNVGRGQHDEVSRFVGMERERSTLINAFMVKHIKSDEVVFTQIRESKAFSPNVSNYRDYYGCVCMIDQHLWEMAEVMDCNDISWIYANETENDIRHALLLIASKL